MKMGGFIRRLLAWLHRRGPQATTGRASSAREIEASRSLLQTRLKSLSASSAKLMWTTRVIGEKSALIEQVRAGRGHIVEHEQRRRGLE
jgi:hypothetical protein